MNTAEISQKISDWILDYAQKSNTKTLVVGISGGIDSALVSTLCAQTGMKTLVFQLPIRQTNPEKQRAAAQIDFLMQNFSNVQADYIDLSLILETYEKILPLSLQTTLNMANLRSRIRMSTLYAFAGANEGLVIGTGNKIEDFGVGFFTKYGDGGVDISPIADLYKSEVFALARFLKVPACILEAAPTDGLFEDGRTDEQQLGATYDELEWAMQYQGNFEDLDPRQQEVWKIFTHLNAKNQHKMLPIPVCKIDR